VIVTSQSVVHVKSEEFDLLQVQAPINEHPEKSTWIDDGTDLRLQYGETDYTWLQI